MIRFISFRRMAAAILVALALAAPVTAQNTRETYTNLKVLPKDIAPEELRGMMNGFTRALGVRCIHCHVGEEGKPFKPGAFALDDKPEKLKARVMIQMMRDLNEKVLPTLATRSTPPVGVQCVTCHRGAIQPRMLQDVLKATYDSEGIDSTLAEYQTLRDRYYGRFTYDFGEVPLADLGNQLGFSGHGADGERLLSLNVDMNPQSRFAKRQYALAAITQGFGSGDAAAGPAAYQRMKTRFGDTVVSEELVNEIGYDLMHENQLDPAIAAFKLNVAGHPASGNAYDSMGEAYMQRGENKLAIQAYSRSLELDATNENAKQKLVELKAKPARPKAKR